MELRVMQVGLVVASRLMVCVQFFFEAVASGGCTGGKVQRIETQKMLVMQADGKNFSEAESQRQRFNPHCTHSFHASSTHVQPDGQPNQRNARQLGPHKHC